MQIKPSFVFLAVCAYISIISALPVDYANDLSERDRGEFGVRSLDFDVEMERRARDQGNYEVRELSNFQNGGEFEEFEARATKVQAEPKPAVKAKPRRRPVVRPTRPSSTNAVEQFFLSRLESMLETMTSSASASTMTSTITSTASQAETTASTNSTISSTTTNSTVSSTTASSTMSATTPASCTISATTNTTASPLQPSASTLFATSSTVTSTPTTSTATYIARPFDESEKPNARYYKLNARSAPSAPEAPVVEAEVPKPNIAKPSVTLGAFASFWDKIAAQFKDLHPIIQIPIPLGGSPPSPASPSAAPTPAARALDETEELYRRLVARHIGDLETLN